MKAKAIAPGKLSRTISALANADGGEVFVGIDGPKDGPFTWAGFGDEEDANAHLQLIEELFPIGPVTRCEFLACPPNAGLVLHIEVEKTSDIRSASDGIAYLRRGAQNLPQDTPEKLDRLKLDKGITSFEEINNAIARSICFIGSENSVKRIFQKMIASGLIIRVPDRPLNKTGYVKGPNFPS